MPDIHLSRAAQADLVGIWTSSFESWGSAQADRYLDDIDRALRALSDNPLMGQDCSDILMGARRLITGRHIAFYEVQDTRIFVIRVLHQSMDLPQRLRQS